MDCITRALRMVYCLLSQASDTPSSENESISNRKATTKTVEPRLDASTVLRGLRLEALKIFQAEIRRAFAGNQNAGYGSVAEGHTESYPRLQGGRFEAERGQVVK